MHRVQDRIAALQLYRAICWNQQKMGLVSAGFLVQILPAFRQGHGLALRHVLQKYQGIGDSAVPIDNQPL